MSSGSPIAKELYAVREYGSTLGSFLEFSPHPSAVGLRHMLDGQSADKRERVAVVAPHDRINGAKQAADSFENKERAADCRFLSTLLWPEETRMLPRKHAETRSGASR